jgi:hypothetical protein
MTEKMPVQDLADIEQDIVSFFIQLSPLNYPRRKKLTFTFAFWQGFVVQMGNCKWQKQHRLQSHWQALGEAKICLILANRAIIKRILHANRKGGFYVLFRIPNYN